MIARARAAFARSQMRRELLDTGWVIGLLIAALLCFAASVACGVAR